MRNHGWPLDKGTGHHMKVLEVLSTQDLILIIPIATVIQIVQLVDPVERLSKIFTFVLLKEA